MTMALSLTPHYTLPAPVIIGSRLIPAVAIGNGFVSVEATMVEDGYRVHFRYYIDGPTFETYTSGPSDVTVPANSWTHAALLALEAVTDSLTYAGSGEPAPEWIPADVDRWLESDGTYMDAATVREDIETAIEELTA